MTLLFFGSPLITTVPVAGQKKSGDASVSCVVIIFIREDDGRFAHRVSLGGGQANVLLWWLVSHVVTDSSAPSPQM